jgi:putative flavoprotein involved in K+ transport
MNTQTLHYDTIVIGGGQAGLATGYYLKQQGQNFVILDAGQRVGDAWRHRWDSLRLFTPARYDGLAGLRFPAPGHTFPTKDEMADYLEAYAEHFKLLVRLGVRVDRLTRESGRLVVTAGQQRFEADRVVVALSNFQQPHTPVFARELDPSIQQMHSWAYRNLAQLQPGPVLVVGAGNSGAEVALEVARRHATWLAGPDTGHVPFRIDSLLARLILVRVILGLAFHRLMTLSTPMGRRMRARSDGRALPLIRTKPRDLAVAGVQRVPRVVGVQDGQPLLEDGRVLKVANVVWATGFKPNFEWIDLPGVPGGVPVHTRGVATNEPGLYFVGLEFQYAISSAMVQGVSRDAQYVVAAMQHQPAAQREQVHIAAGGAA